MMRYNSSDDALVPTDLRSNSTPLGTVVLVIMAVSALPGVLALVRWAYATYVQDPLLKEYGALIDDIVGRIPGIDNLLIVDHPDRWFLVARVDFVVVAVLGVMFLVVAIILKTRQDRDCRRFYDATDANSVERRIVNRLTAGFPTLMREHGIGVHTTIDRAFSGGTRTRITPPILHHITMEPSGLRVAVRPATDQNASELADQWEKSASIFQEIDFDTAVEGNVVYVQLYTRTGGAPDVTLNDLNGGDE